MFVASYHNTMAGAKLRATAPLPDETVLKTLRPREQARLREIEEARQRHVAMLLAEARAAETFIRQRKEANEAIRRANAVLSNSNDEVVSSTFRRICRALKVHKRDLLADRRNARIVFARQAVMYWLCRRTRFSLPQIGRLIGDRDHTTILHGKRAYVAKRAKMGRYLRPVN